MLFDQIFSKILLNEQLTNLQKQLTDKYTNQRKASLSFGPIFKQERTYYPVQKNNLQLLKTPENIIDALDNIGYYVTDYRAGIAMKKAKQGQVKDLRKIKVGKILTKLNNAELLKQFNERLKTSRKEIGKLSICITYNPYDIAGMSTNRNWTSCMSLDEGMFSTTALNQVVYGGMCAYLIDENDKNIEKPIARIAIKRLVGTKNLNTFMFIQEPTIYGDELLAKEVEFDKQVKSILDESNKLTMQDEQHFKRDDNESYSDGNLNDYYKKESWDTLPAEWACDWCMNGAPLEALMFFASKFKDNYNWQWEHISELKNLPEIFLEKFKNYIDWRKYANENVLSEKQIEKFQDVIDWDAISSYPELAETFIQKFADKLNWKKLSAHSAMSEEFINKHIKQIDIPALSINHDIHLSTEFILKHQNKLNLELMNMLNTLPMELKKKFNFI